MQRIGTYLFILFLSISGGVLQCNRDGSRNIEGGDFTLTDHNGQEFHLHDLHGKTVLIYFGYTTCPDACPFTMSKIKRVYEILGPERSKKIQTIFITVDPDRDTAQKLGKYLAYFHVNAIGLSGTPAEIRKVSDQYGVTYEKADRGSAVGYLVDHTTYTYLVDVNGKLRHRFRHADTPASMASIIKVIAP